LFAISLLLTSSAVAASDFTLCGDEVGVTVAVAADLTAAAIMAEVYGGANHQPTCISAGVDGWEIKVVGVKK